MFQSGLHYITFENVIEWSCYISSLLFAIDFSDCHARTGLRFDWQWQAGSFAITSAWLNLLSNIRKFPFLGIYVVMFTDVLLTFLKFAVIVIMFIVAFSMGFHCLLANQVRKMKYLGHYNMYN